MHLNDLIATDPSNERIRQFDKALLHAVGLEYMTVTMQRVKKFVVKNVYCRSV